MLCIIISFQLRESDEKAFTLSKENEILLKQKDSALQEAHLWRTELGKAREHAVISEAAVLRADETARAWQADGEDKHKESAKKQMAFAKEKEELMAYVNILQLQIQRSKCFIKTLSSFIHSFLIAVLHMEHICILSCVQQSHFFFLITKED